MAGLKLIITVILCNVVVFCNTQKKVEQPKPIDETRIGYVEFLNSDKSKNIEVLVEVAENDYARSKGLMFREDLPENQGMIFIFDEEKERYFWMKNTPVSLDIVFVDSTYKIIKIHKETAPYSTGNYASGQPAKYVVEVRAGFTDRYLIQEGNYIRLTDL